MVEATENGGTNKKGIESNAASLYSSLPFSSSLLGSRLESPVLPILRTARVFFGRGVAALRTRDGTYP